MITSYNTPATFDGFLRTPSCKVEVLAMGESRYSSNGLRFCTVDGAAEYARDLTTRWTMVRAWRIVPCEDEPNRD